MLLMLSTMLPGLSVGSELRYLALGDSYTIGEGVDPQQRWPEQLVARLQADGIAVARPRIIATTGWTTAELAAAMDAAEPLGEWDLVSLLIGVNNQYRGLALSEFEQQLRALLQRSIALAGGRADRVLVLAIPDWGVTPFAHDRDRMAIAAQLDAYNAAGARVCAAHQVAFVDIAAVSRRRGAEPAMLAADGLHPSAELYRLWTDAALPIAREHLSR